MQSLPTLLLLILLPALGAPAEAQSRTKLPPAQPETPAEAPQTLLPERAPQPPATAFAQAQGDSTPRAPSITGTPSIPFDRVYYDRPGDGNLWAMGAAYKARFGAQGVRYIPYLGPEAPLNRPLDLTLESVTLGGQPLTFGALGDALREGDVVHFDRGTLTELYVLTPETVEQRFRFDRLPADAAGDLVVEVGVATDLALAPVPSSEDPGGFEWTSPLGSVRYGRATVLDAGGASAHAPTRLANGRIEIRVPAAFVASAELPLTIDPVLSTFGVDSSSHFDLFPDIAYDRQTGRWAIVWSRLFSAGDWDVYCLTVSFIGSPIEGAFIDLTDLSWIEARVANNRHASQFLVVAEVGPTGSRFIGGRTREAGSTSMNNQFGISSGGSNEQVNPDVGGDPYDSSGSYYLVVWEYATSDSNHDIRGQLVQTSGLPLGGRLMLADSSNDERAPAVNNSNDTQNWTVAYEREFDPSDHDIWATQVHWSGTIAHPSYIVDFSSEDDRTPSVSSPLDEAGSEGPYLVAYRRGDGSNRDIQGKVMQANVPVTGSTNLTQLLGPASAFLDQSLPAVDSDGSTFILAHSQQEIGSTNQNVAVSALTLANGALLRAEQTTIWAGTTQSESAPRIYAQRSSGGPDTFVFGTWSSATDIEGGRYGTPGAGDVYCTSFPHSAGGPAQLAADGSISLVNNSLSLLVRSAPPNKTGLFFVGSNQVSQTFGDGRRCVGGSVRRIQPLATTDGQGFAVRALDTSLPYGSAFFAGAPGINFQFWFRDPQGGPAGFNYSNALHIEFQE